MGFVINNGRKHYLNGFFSRRVLQYPSCWYCDRSSRPSCLTCEGHKSQEKNAVHSLSAALAENRVVLDNLPVCWSCQCHYLTNTSTVNVCDSCLLEAVKDTDSIFSKD